MELRPDKFKQLLPLPLTLITTCDAAGQTNAAPYSCVMPVLRPLELIALASALSRDTLRNIHATGQFVVNVMGRNSFREAVSCAKKYPSGVNELEASGLATLPSNQVSPPRVRDAAGWIEAAFETELPGEDYCIVVGKVLCAEINERYYGDGQFTEPPLVLLFPHFREIGGPVARRDEFDV